MLKINLFTENNQTETFVSNYISGKAGFDFDLIIPIKIYEANTSFIVRDLIPRYTFEQWSQLGWCKVRSSDPQKQARMNEALRTFKKIPPRWDACDITVPDTWDSRAEIYFNGSIKKGR